MNSRAIAAAALILALSACGGRQALQRPTDHGAPPIARGASAPLTADQYMAPTAQSRPERNAELLKQSKEREDDPFDLPPGTKNPPPPPGAPTTPQ